MTEIDIIKKIKETGLRTPLYLIDEGRLRKNGEILKKVQEDTGCKILLAQKAFSNFNFYPLLKNYLAGTEASGLYEARLGAEEWTQSGKQAVIVKTSGMAGENRVEGAETEKISGTAGENRVEGAVTEKNLGTAGGNRVECDGTEKNPGAAGGNRVECTETEKISGTGGENRGEGAETEDIKDGTDASNRGECHVFCAAYREDEFDELLKYADHIVFNSPGQLKKFGPKAKAAGKSVGLRINPECSTQEGHEIYDPCAPGSRLGTTREQWDELMTEDAVSLLDGVHFHTLCEQNSDALEITLAAVREKFGDILSKMKWINMGGGHHITRDDYDIERLERCIKSVFEEYGVQVYLEPGEAVALNAGYLVTQVLDTVRNAGVNIAILDMSAACHTPDVIEMPYRPPLLSAGEAGEKPYDYRLGGPTCLSGDIVGDYSFDRPLSIGDYLVFGDMAIYTTVKNNTFNGMPLPAIYSLTEEGNIRNIVNFGYDDFKGRLGR